MHWFLKFIFRIQFYIFRTVPSWSCSQAVSKPVWHIPLLCVQWKLPDDGQRNCSKHVELYSKNKFEKLVHLVGFIIRIYHDARSPERQMHYFLLIYFNSNPLHVSDRLAAHHQNDQLCINSNWYKHPSWSCQQPVNITHDYTNCCLYTVDPPDDELQACSKHVEA